LGTPVSLEVAEQADQDDDGLGGTGYQSEQPGDSIPAWRMFAMGIAEEPRQLWYLSIARRWEGRYEVTVRDLEGITYFEEVAPGWEAVEALIRALEPHALAEILINRRTSEPSIRVVPRAPGTTIDDLVKRAGIELEKPHSKARLILKNQTFDQVEATIGDWRRHWRRPGVKL
jgi:hypothetical protein